MRLLQNGGVSETRQKVSKRSQALLNFNVFRLRTNGTYEIAKQWCLMRAGKLLTRLTAKLRRWNRN